MRKLSVRLPESERGTVVKPFVCNQTTEVYVPQVECSDCEEALYRLDNLTAEDVKVDDESISFTSGRTYSVSNVQDELEALVTEISETQTEADESASDIATQLASKQDRLISGTNIMTINNQSILGSGNITISGSGETMAVDSALNSTSTNPVQNAVITDALNGKQSALSAGSGISIENDTVSTPLADYFCARLTSTTATTAGTSKTVTLSTYKQSGNAFSISSGSIVCNTAGTYEVSASAAWSPDANTATCLVAATLDNNSTTIMTASNVSVVGTKVTTAMPPVAVTISAGDTISLTVTATGLAGSIAGGVQNTRVMIRRLA